MMALIFGILLTGPCVSVQASESGETPSWTYALSPESLLSEYARLVNRDNLLPSDYAPTDLVRISARKSSSSALLMREAASKALSAMFDAADGDSMALYADSGYRSYQTQKTMYNNRLEKNNGVDDGVVAYPGSSDHQTGLAMDVISKAWIDKKYTTDFGKTAEAGWMAAHCAEYGFIIRYPEGKEDITKIIYEPWHLRYVGVEAAQYIMRNGLTLEEFTAEWQGYQAEFEAGGGNVQQTLIQGQLPPEAMILDVVGEDGDPEVSLYH